MLGRLLRRSTRRENDPLSRELLRWSRNDPWTVRDAAAGTLVLGSTGSGKTSGSGRTIARSMLSAGFGGLVLTAKKDERALWENYCRETGRLKDLIVVGPNEPWRFNFLQYEVARQGSGAGQVPNIEALLVTASELGDRLHNQGGGQHESDRYWRDAMKEMARAAIEVLLFAKGHVSVPDLYRLIISAPSSIQEKVSKDWQANSFCFECLKEADAREKTEEECHDFATDVDFFMVRYPKLADKTRSIIESVFVSMVDLLNRGMLRRLFCGDTNFTPDMLEDGKIILVDLPILEFGMAGLYGQGILKYCFQTSLMRRSFASDARPKFLWIDEMQFFLTSNDMEFLSTCRAGNVAAVFLSQNISNFYAALGGAEQAKPRVNSIFANLNTKILHANGDPVTNEWAAQLIGMSRQFMMNGSSTYDADDEWTASLGLDWFGRQGSTTAGFNEDINYEVQPREFTLLRTGGPAHDWTVDGIVFQNGRLFQSSGRTWLKTAFQQRS